MENRWIEDRVEQDAPKMRLFCMPFAGSGTTFFSQWQEYLGEEIEVCPIQLPGHQTRMDEPLIDNVKELAQAMLEGIIPLTEDMPYAFWGHSSGAVLSYEVAKQIEEYGLMGPECIFLSGAGVKYNPKGKPLSQQNPDEMVESLNRMLGWDVREYEAMNLYDEQQSNILKNDFGMVEKYQVEPESKIDARIRVYYAEKEMDMPFEDIEAWKEHTRADVSFCGMGDNHGYIIVKQKEMCEDIKRCTETI